MYSPQDYLLFFLALAICLGGLALLGVCIEWQENRKAKKRERQLQTLNRYQDLRRRHNNYLEKMQKVLSSVEGKSECMSFYTMGPGEPAAKGKPIRAGGYESKEA